jgi:hypothetical protein
MMTASDVDRIIETHGYQNRSLAGALTPMLPHRAKRSLRFAGEGTLVA